MNRSDSSKSVPKIGTNGTERLARVRESELCSVPIPVPFRGCSVPIYRRLRRACGLLLVHKSIGNVRWVLQYEAAEQVAA
jgi:hypothetical protein